MATQTIPAVDLEDYRAGGASRARFVEGVGRALVEIGFFSVRNHGIDRAVVDETYRAAQRFFHLPSEVKRRSEIPSAHGQRGYTSFGREHAKGSTEPDLKEFFQVGRTNVPATHPVHAAYGPNVWPEEAPELAASATALYEALDGLGAQLLRASAAYLGESAERFAEMAVESDTILRVIYYPPLRADTTTGVRAAAHEDINLITLLPAATAEGLELRQRDGRWLPIDCGGDDIIVDAGDMLQNVTNGLFRSTTHRVVNPANATEERFSMPCFIHPRKEIDLTPLPSCVARSGGTARFPRVTAGEYLTQRLREIGLQS